MKTSKRILRLQAGLQNSCDLPKPISGITKPDVYGATLQHKTWTAKHLEYFNRKPLSLQNKMWQHLEEGSDDCTDILQHWLLRLLNSFHHLLEKKSVTNLCLNLQNMAAAIVLYEKGDNYMEAFDITLKCLIENKQDNMNYVVLDLFYKYLRSVHAKPDFRAVQTNLFSKLISFWSKNKLDFLWLESELLTRSEPSDIGSLVYILFCTPPPSQQTHKSSQEKENTTQPLDYFSPEFLLKLSQLFTRVSHKIGISSRLAEPSSRGSSPQESLRQILDKINQQDK